MTPAAAGKHECPSPDMLLRLACDSGDDLPASLEAHLLQCEHCLSVLEDHDPPTDALLEALAAMPDTADDEPALQEARQALYAAAATMSGARDLTTSALPRALADPPLGPLPVRLSNYELVECIGRGATGAVYRGRHVKLDQPVAVKVLDSTRLNRAHTVDRFVQEMKTVGQLRHPNIIRATDAGEVDGWHFLVMEYVDGLDASRLLRLAGPISLPNACEICRQAALGLQHAHKRSLVHRDVKPTNLLVTTSGEVKLLDLGIAVTIGDGGQEGTHRVGTVGYAPPEQWQSVSPVDARADLFSLGCTLCKLLTGKTPPPPASSRSATTRRPPALSDTPRGLQRLVEQMLASAPAARPPSAAVVAEQLATWTGRSDLAGLVAQARGESPRSEGVRSVPQQALGGNLNPITRRRALGLASVAGAGLLAWNLGTSRTPQLNRMRPRKLSPAPPEVFLTAGSTGDVVWEVAEDDSIHLESTELALLQLGRPVIGKYKMAVDLLQAPWRGNVGIFFQGRHILDNDERLVEFQMLELLPADDLQPTGTGRLLWSRCHAPHAGGPDIRREMWAEVAVAMGPDGAPRRLEACFGRTGMPEVSWNGIVLDPGAWSLSTEGKAHQRLAAGQLPSAFLGKLGLVNGNGRSTFLRPTLTYL